MKHLFAKWLSALLIAALLLTPVAVMEEADTEAPVAVEAGNDDGSYTEPDEAVNDGDEGHHHLHRKARQEESQGEVYRFKVEPE